jgi:hypothetical protein
MLLVPGLLVNLLKISETPSENICMLALSKKLSKVKKTMQKKLMRMSGVGTPKVEESKADPVVEPTIPISKSMDDLADLNLTPRELAVKQRKRNWNRVRKLIPEFARQRRESFKTNAIYGRLCILDAFQGRLSNGLANNSKKSWWIYTIFCIQTSDWLFNCVIAACVFNTLSVFFEPANACSSSPLYGAVQVLILLIYAFDIGLKMSYEGIHVSSTNIYYLFQN